MLGSGRLRKTHRQLTFHALRFALLENSAGVGEVQHGKVQTAAGVAFLGGTHLCGDLFGGRCGEVFHYTDANGGFEDDDQEAVLVDTDDKHAEFFALLINAVEVGFVNEVGDGLVGHVGAGSEGGDGGQIELARIALSRDEETAFIDDQGRCGIALFEQFPQRLIEALNVFLDKLWQCSHVMRTAGCPG